MSEVSKQYIHEKDYIMLPLSADMFEHFPNTVEYGGEILHKKSEFHVSLVCAKENITTISKDELASFFDGFVNKTPISFNSFNDEFRFVVKDERKTVILSCIINNLEEFFVALNQEFGIKMPTQPAHVTLYTLQKEIGIGINSDEEMESTEEIQIPELSKALVGLKS